MKICAVIPSYYVKDSEYLKVCVESLRATTNWDIIVVTNGTKAKPVLPFKGFTNHLHTKDQGQCVAVNIGAQLAAPDTDYIFVVNSDMYFAPGWNKQMEFRFNKGLCFSPNLVEPVDNAGSAPPFLKLDAGNDLESFKPAIADDYVERMTKELKAPEPGFNLPFFIDLNLWRTIGGYDVAYDPYGSNSDTDLQCKINLAGVTPKRLTDILVYHFSNKSGTFEDDKRDFWQNNWDYFQSKWGFNRDELKSDVWMNKDMLPELSKIKYKPDWVNKYA